MQNITDPTRHTVTPNVLCNVYSDEPKRKKVTLRSIHLCISSPLHTKASLEKMDIHWVVPPEWSEREGNAGQTAVQKWHIPRETKLVRRKTKINICRCVCQALNDCGCSETPACHFTLGKSIFDSELHGSVLHRIQKPFWEKSQTDSSYLVTRPAYRFPKWMLRRRVKNNLQTLCRIVSFH